MFQRAEKTFANVTCPLCLWLHRQRGSWSGWSTCSSSPLPLFCFTDILKVHAIVSACIRRVVFLQKGQNNANVYNKHERRSHRFSWGKLALTFSMFAWDETVKTLFFPGLTCYSREGKGNENVFMRFLEPRSRVTTIFYRCADVQEPLRDRSLPRVLSPSTCTCCCFPRNATSWPVDLTKTSKHNDYINDPWCNANTKLFHFSSPSYSLKCFWYVTLVPRTYTPSRTNAAFEWSP